ncbi:SN protein, partial [Penelope pileata]|nr:SN protein [Penelope pileata]
QYRCTATNAMGNATATRPFVPRATRVLVHPAAEVREGEDVTLSCVAQGDTLGPATYTWYRNGRRLAGGTEPLLHLPSIRSEDGGAFQCQAQGRGDSGDSDTSVAVTLRVLCECQCGGSQSIPTFP